MRRRHELRRSRNDAKTFLPDSDGYLHFIRHAIAHVQLCGKHTHTSSAPFSWLQRESAGGGRRVRIASGPHQTSIQCLPQVQRPYRHIVEIFLCFRVSDYIPEQQVGSAAVQRDRKQTDASQPRFGNIGAGDGRLCGRLRSRFPEVSPSLPPQQLPGLSRCAFLVAFLGRVSLSWSKYAPGYTLMRTT